MSRIACFRDFGLIGLCSLSSSHGAARTSSTDSAMVLRTQHCGRITDPPDPEGIACPGHRDEELTADEVETLRMGFLVFVRVALLAKRLGVEARKEDMLELQTFR